MSLDESIHLAPDDESGRESLGSNSGYAVKIPIFEGPLDLLLHLIRQNEVEINTFPPQQPIANVAACYMTFRRTKPLPHPAQQEIIFECGVIDSGHCGSRIALQRLPSRVFAIAIAIGIAIDPSSQRKYSIAIAIPIAIARGLQY